MTLCELRIVGEFIHEPADTKTLDNLYRALDWATYDNGVYGNRERLKALVVAFITECTSKMTKEMK